MKTYTPEKKQEAIDRFISGESAAAILADIGIPKSTFYNWVRIYQEEQAELNRKTVDIGCTFGNNHRNSQIRKLHT